MPFWQSILETRSAVSKQLEELRSEKIIGSSLDAEVSVFCNGELNKNMQQLENELRFVMITSEATVATPDKASNESVDVTLANGETIRIETKASAHNKCVRCWHHRDDVGTHKEHPELCGRCVENVAGDGEVRRFA